MNAREKIIFKDLERTVDHLREANIALVENRDRLTEKIRDLSSQNATLQGALQAQQQKNPARIQQLETNNRELRECIGKLQGVAKHMINVIGNEQFGRGHLV